MDGIVKKKKKRPKPVVCFKRHLYFQSCPCLILHWLCRKLFARSVCLTRSGILFGGRGVARSAANTFKNSSMWWSSQATPCLWTDVGILEHLQSCHSLCKVKATVFAGGRWESKVTRSRAALILEHHKLHLGDVPFYIFLLGTCVWLKYLLQRTVKNHLLTETWTCHRLLDFSPTQFLVFYHLAL